MSDYKAKFDGFDGLNEDYDWDELEAAAEAVIALPVPSGGPQQENTNRAAYAAVALALYANRTGPDEALSKMTDLITDLHHLADALDIDFDGVLRASLNHHGTEQAGLR